MRLSGFFACNESILGQEFKRTGSSIEYGISDDAMLWLRTKNGIVASYDYLHQNLVEASLRAGFTVLESGVRCETALMPRDYKMNKVLGSNNAIEKRFIESVSFIPGIKSDAYVSRYFVDTLILRK